jgi:hypothetical protein
MEGVYQECGHMWKWDSHTLKFSLMVLML